MDLVVVGPGRRSGGAHDVGYVLVTLLLLQIVVGITGFELCLETERSVLSVPLGDGCPKILRPQRLAQFCPMFDLQVFLLQLDLLVLLADAFGLGFGILVLAALGCVGLGAEGVVHPDGSLGELALVAAGRSGSVAAASAVSG